MFFQAEAEALLVLLVPLAQEMSLLFVLRSA